MIDGVYPSQLASVEAMRTSHYRNLKSIMNSTSSPKVSWLSTDIRSVSSRKKYNHQNWLIFNKNREEEQRCKRNADIYQKLRRISSDRSRYSIRTEASPSKDQLLHHNYLYECSRRYQQIEKGNQLIISRLSNPKGDINHSRLEKQFRINKRNVSRLEKFERFKRLNRVVSKNLKEKFPASGGQRSFILTNPQQQ